jgi:type VI secretion system secreted protein VgrG
MPTQTERPLRIDTPLGPDAVLLESWTGNEQISAPFHFRLGLLSENPRLAADSLLHQPAVVTLDLHDSSQRYVHGLVSSITQRGQDGRLTHYEAELVPWLWFLSLSTDCRIFQIKSVPEIAEEVFRQEGFRDFRFDLQTSYAPREYCVQYRETNLAFVSRLLEEEGIYYFFEHTRERHVLVLADTVSAVKPCPHQELAVYGAHGEHHTAANTVLDLERRELVHAGRVTLRDYDFKKPSFNLEAKVEKPCVGERYDYPGLYATRDEGERCARLRLEEEEARSVLVQGGTLCRGLTPGYRFDLKGHYRPDFNQPYTVVRVEHEGRNAGWESGSKASFHYENRVNAIPHSVVYRPQRVTPKPVIQGAQTAVVVGSPGSEIWVDKYGRVKVQFRWDREGQHDDRSSCWVRVAQGWAGKGWGMAEWPRVGQEVIVDFLEGDPDRPIVVGRVYNAELMPPYELPANQTVAGVRTRSSPGGGASNYSEIRFEDKKGAEELGIHAERDKSEEVERDSREWVGNDRTLTVKHDRVEQVDGGDHETVGGERRTRIGSEWSIELGTDHQEKVGTLYALDAGQEIHVKAGQKVVIEAGAQVTIKGPGGFVSIDASGVTIRGTLVRINSSGPGPGAGSGVDVKSPRVSQPATSSGRTESPTPKPLQTGRPAAVGLAAVLAARRRSWKQPPVCAPGSTQPGVVSTLRRASQAVMQQARALWDQRDKLHDKLEDGLLEIRGGVDKEHDEKQFEKSLQVSHTWLDKEGAVKKWGDDKNNIQLLSYGAHVSSGVKVTKDGASVDVIKAEAHLTGAEANGEKEMLGGAVDLKGSVKVMDLEGEADVGATFDKDAKEIHAKAGASIDLVKAEGSGELRIPIPFTGHFLTFGGTAEAGIGAAAEAQVGGGWTKDQGFSWGGSAKLGFGPSAGLSFKIGFK